MRHYFFRVFCIQTILTILLVLYLPLTLALEGKKKNKPQVLLVEVKKLKKGIKDDENNSKSSLTGSKSDGSGEDISDHEDSEDSEDIEDIEDIEYSPSSQQNTTNVTPFTTAETVYADKMLNSTEVMQTLDVFQQNTTNVTPFTTAEPVKPEKERIDFPEYECKPYSQTSVGEQKIIITAEKLQDGIYDCSDGSDEHPSLIKKKCNDSEQHIYLEVSEVCINKNKICNDVFDTLNAEDERDKHCQIPEGKYLCESDGTWHSTYELGNGVGECPSIHSGRAEGISYSDEVNPSFVQNPNITKIITIGVVKNNRKEWGEKLKKYFSGNDDTLYSNNYSIKKKKEFNHGKKELTLRKNVKFKKGENVISSKIPEPCINKVNRHCNLDGITCDKAKGYNVKSFKANYDGAYQVLRIGDGEDKCYRSSQLCNDKHLKKYFKGYCKDINFVTDNNLLKITPDKNDFPCWSNNTLTAFPGNKLLDGVQDCDDGSDENTEKVAEHHYKRMVVDRCGILSSKNSKRFKSCYEKLQKEVSGIKKEQIVEYNDDQKSEALSRNSTYKNPNQGDYTCSLNQTISLSQVADGGEDCYNGADETIKEHTDKFIKILLNSSPDAIKSVIINLPNKIEYRSDKQEFSKFEILESGKNSTIVFEKYGSDFKPGIVPYLQNTLFQEYHGLKAIRYSYNSLTITAEKRNSILQDDRCTFMGSEACNFNHPIDFRYPSGCHKKQLSLKWLCFNPVLLNKYVIAENCKPDSIVCQGNGKPVCVDRDKALDGVKDCYKGEDEDPVWLDQFEIYNSFYLQLKVSPKNIKDKFPTVIKSQLSELNTFIESASQSVDDLDLRSLKLIEIIDKVIKKASNPGKIIKFLPEGILNTVREEYPRLNL